MINARSGVGQGETEQSPERIDTHAVVGYAGIV
jgi:hypothetical protein